jgi:hypothetical protein
VDLARTARLGRRNTVEEYNGRLGTEKKLRGVSDVDRVRQFREEFFRE